VSDQSSQASERSFSAYLPLFLLALAIVTNFSFQTSNLINEANQLEAAISKQEPAILEGQKVRGQLAEIAKQALALANQGNKNAATLIETMSKKGVNIKASEADVNATGTTESE